MDVSRLALRFFLSLTVSFLLSGTVAGQPACTPKPCPAVACGWVDDGCGDLQLCNNRRPCPTGEKGVCGWCDDECGGRYCETCQCVPEADQQMCARLTKACEGEDLAFPPRLIARGDDNCGVYREIDCGPCAEAERIHVTEPDPASVVTYGSGKIVINHALIHASEGTTRTEVASLAADFGASLIGQLPETSDFQLQIPSGDIDELLAILARLEEDPRVQAVSPNIYVTAPSAAPPCLVESDLGRLQGKERCAAAQILYDEALTIFEHFRHRLKLAYVGIGILDTGLDLGPNRCPELKSTRIYSGGGASPPVGDKPGREWHGTAVTALIAADDDGTGLNGIASRFLGNHLRLQVAGVYNAPLLTVRERVGRLLRANAVLNFSGQLDYSGLPAEFRQKWADNERAWWGRQMRAHPDTLLVVAAPNLPIELKDNNLFPPAGNIDAFNHVTVGGVTSCPGELGAVLRPGKSGSAYGSNITLAAPSDNLKTVVGDCRLGVVTGNSFAAPQVASLAAIIRSLHPRITGSLLHMAVGNSVCGNDLKHGVPLLCMSRGVIGALWGLEDPVINATLSPRGIHSNPPPWLIGGGGDEPGWVLARICDMGVRHTTAVRGTVWYKMEDLATGGYMSNSIGAAGSTSFDLSVENQDDDVSYGTLIWGENFRPGRFIFGGEGPDTASFLFTPYGDSINVGSSSGEFEIRACRIDERSHGGFAGFYPSSISVVGRFRGTCLDNDTEVYNPCAGAFYVPFAAGADLTPDLATYLEKTCDRGLPELRQP